MNESLVKQAILPLPGLLIVAFITALVFGLQTIVYAAIASSTVAQKDLTCSVTAVDDGGGNGLFGTNADPSMKVKCEGKDYIITSATFVVSYLQKPGSLICDINKLGRANCHLQE